MMATVFGEQGVVVMTVMELDRTSRSVFSVDETVWVEACAVDGGGLVPLSVDSTTAPVTVDGWTTYAVRLVGGTNLMTPGRHRAHLHGLSFTVTLTRESMTENQVTYSAFVMEPEHQLV
jgi:hypothetical protein